MKLEFCIQDYSILPIVQSLFSDEPDICIKYGSITTAAFNTLIAAGNSFAEMNGGVDGAINTHLSQYTSTKYIQQDVKELLTNEYSGELPVGQSICIRTDHPYHKYLIYAPTMRVAEDVSSSINAYLALRGALITMKKHNIESASTTLFCTGAGCMSIKRACLQMKEAFRSVRMGNLIGGDWTTYHTHHRFLHTL